MSDSASIMNPPHWQDRAGRGLMGFAAIGALGAFAYGANAVSAAPPEFIWVETWRMFGFLVFAGFFAVLALRPRLSAGVWELVALHKAALVVAALALPSAPEIAASATVDAVLVVLIGAAYVLTRGWRSWRAREAAA